MRAWLYALALASIVTLVGCRPSGQPAATRTLTPPTSAPPPGQTATPNAYSLTIHVQDANGAAIPNASVVIPEAGSTAAKKTDASGTLSWMNLPDPEVNLKVSAPGYYGASQPVTMNPGKTELVITLLADPFALLPADACAPNEKLLYSEDFEDGQAPGWPNITAAVDSHADNGWSVRAQSDGNQTASVTGIHESVDDLQGYTFKDVVWRLRVMEHGQDGFSVLDFRHAQAAGIDTRYAIEWGAAPYMSLVHMQTPDTGSNAGKVSTLRMQPDRWYYLEISAYQAVIQVWVNGRQLLEYDDPQPLPAGTIGLEAHIFKDPQTAYFFDDLSVCELNAPFATSLYKPPAP